MFFAVLAEIVVANFATDLLACNLNSTDATVVAADMTVSHSVHSVTGGAAVELRSAKGNRLATALRTRFHGEFLQIGSCRLLVSIQINQNDRKNTSGKP